VTTPNFDLARLHNEPFPHISLPDLIAPDSAEAVLSWLRFDAPWRLKVTDFYEQHEFSLLAEQVPAECEFLVDPAFVAVLTGHLQPLFAAGSLHLVDIAAHRLTAGQTIRIHNDYLGGEETHRLLVQFNTGWDDSNGGLLMLFGADDVSSLSRAIIPRHASGLGFEISPSSYHAVSTIHGGERYTIVYTFRDDRALAAA